jgi:hypothetical protein
MADQVGIWLGGVADMAIGTLCRQAWSGAYAVKGDRAAAQCVVAFSFGHLADGSTTLPGPSNEDLARIAADQFADLPKVLQREVADAYLALAPGSPVFRINVHRRPGKYLDTREAAAQAAAVLREHGWRTAVLLAHACHVPRVTAVCEKLGIAAVVPPGLEQVRFCRGSRQPWTRNRVLWFLREVPTLGYYRCKGWL